MITTEKVLDALKNVDDPDLKKDIVSLGMVKDLKVEGKKITFSVELTTPACPLKDAIKNACLNAIKYYVSADAEVEICMTARKITAPMDKNQTTLRDVKNIIAVASGKGGVGKSTIAANLAVALHKLGAKVGLVDADIYGPSQHIIFGVQDEGPGSAEFEGQKKMAPVESYGVKINSIGFMAPSGQAVALRGPMASKALSQLFFDTAWGELDYLVVDLPPGTGDIHISLCTQIRPDAAIVVSTPQTLAISDALKGISLFQIPSINIPVIGLVENMAWFTPEELPDHRYYIFGKGGVEKLSQSTGIPLLAQIPLIQSVRECSDEGRPPVFNEKHPAAIHYLNLASEVARRLSILNFENAGKENTLHHES
ncbi:MAG: Mrp/NBP35 family ATP-binding protein [Bacteroidia bacterium]|nr:Mrp/NBP35 family ATP-binding protein [Bacteroidia bacterium]